MNRIGRVEIMRIATVTSGTTTSSHCHGARHSSDAASSAAARWPTVRIQLAQAPATIPARWLSGTQTSATSPPTKPATVAGATAGAASRLATTATREICPEIAAMAGVHTSWAAIGTAIASAHHRGIHRSRRRANGGASSKIPAVAVTERMKPADRESHGSRNNSPTTAQARARTPPRAPKPSAATPTAPIAAARTTLGSGRASSTKATIESAPSTQSPRRRMPTARPTAITTASTIVRLVPETAMRWVSPLRRKSSSTLSLTRPSSPSTRAGTSASGSSPTGVTAWRTPSRTRSEASHHQVARSAGPRRTTSITAASSDASEGASRPMATNRRPTTRSSASPSRNAVAWSRVLKSASRLTARRTSTSTTTDS